MPNDSTQQLLSIKEAAQFAEKSTKTIRNWIAAGRLKACKANPEFKNSKYQIDKNDLLQMLSLQGNSLPKNKKGIKTTTKSIENTLSLELEILLLKEKLSHSQELLSLERANSQRLEVETQILEERVEDLLTRNQQLAGYKTIFEQEQNKGFLARMFSRPIAPVERQIAGPTD